MGIGIGISMVSVLVSRGYRGGSLKFFRFALRAMVSVLVLHGNPYGYRMGIAAQLCLVTSGRRVHCGCILPSVERCA